MKLNRTARTRSSRRSFLAGTSTLGAAALLGVPCAAWAEPPPEVKKIRLITTPTSVCFAPQFLAEQLLAMEGFTDIEYVELKDGNFVDLVDNGAADLSMEAAPTVVYAMDTYKSVVVLAGIHAGCFELFAHGPIHSLRDLKGKNLAIYAKGGGDHVLLASMLAYVGIDPSKDVHWTVPEDRDTMRLFVEGKADALMAFPPAPQELRARKIGRLIVNTAQDRPWSHQFCCVAVANRDFASKYPVATKRVLRAMLKATDICAEDPARAARFLVDRGQPVRYEMALEVMRDVPYRRWRETDPEDTLRFLALRLHEVGMIKTSPQKLISQGTDWRFLNSLKKELKA